MKLKNTTSVLKMILLLLLVIPCGCKDKVETSERLITKTFNYPVLKGKTDNPVLRIQLQDGKEGEIVNAIQVSTEKTKLENLIKEFHGGGLGGATTNPHAFFGKLTKEEWGIVMYKHLDHHLRQFSA